MSHYNPYAAPQATAPTPGATQQAGPPQPWEIGEVLSLAWEGFKRSWGVLVGSYFLSGLIGAIPGQVPAVAVLVGGVEQNSSTYWTMYSVCMFLGLVVQSFFQPGLTRIWLAVARGQSPDLGTLFGGASKFLPVFASLLLVMLAILAGYVALIVPGIILGLGLMFAQFFVVDADMGPIDAMRASWNATKGHKGKLFLFALVGFLIAFGGFLACCIGMYVSFPLFFVALAIVYVRLSGRGTTPTGYDMTGYGGGQGGGGYGPGGYGPGGYGPGGYGPGGYGPGGYGGGGQGGGGQGGGGYGGQGPGQWGPPGGGGYRGQP